MEPGRAVVVGGSLGGLTVANLLRDAGWEVSVHERSPRPLDGRGAGIVVHEATVRYLLERRDLSLDDVSCPSSWIRHLAPDGSVEHEAPSTYRFTAWNTLYQALLEPMADRYHLGHEVAAVHPQSVELADGRTFDADLIVAADGFDSTVRRQFFPHIAPQYSGYVGWRGLMSEAELSPETFELLADAITYCVLPNSHIVVYPIPTAGGSLEVGRRLINYVWYRNVPTGGPLDDLTTDIHGVRRPVSVPPGLVRTEFVDEMKAFAGDLAPQLAEAIAKTDQPFVQVIVDIETDRMVAGNVALLGDGAFSARPHAAAGTAKAAEDGWRLLAELERHDDLPAALSSWQQTQVALGRQLVARARAIGERSQVHCTWQAGDPELAFGLYGPGR